MARKYKCSKLHVQDLPDGGILVSFRSRHVIDERTVTRIRDELESLVAPERIMLVDLSNMRYLCSAAIGALIIVRRLLHQRAGKMMLCGLPLEIEEFFRIVKLDRLFEIYPDLESALGGSAADAP